MIIMGTPAHTGFIFIIGFRLLVSLSAKFTQLATLQNTYLQMELILPLPSLEH